MSLDIYPWFIPDLAIPEKVLSRQVGKNSLRIVMGGRNEMTEESNVPTHK
jgi:hypothetical protein